MRNGAVETFPNVENKRNDLNEVQEDVPHFEELGKEQDTAKATEEPIEDFGEEISE